jgi:tetratricopeptide (TPR) repeat protein
MAKERSSFEGVEAAMAETVAYKYRAFISYSHADTAWAKWLHRGLEGFRIDKDLVGRETATGTIPKSLRPIFRDRDDFTAGHSLTDQTLAALDASHALIVICSPASAKSAYVTEEIRLYKSRHPERPVIPLIVDGKPGDPELECFPPSLKFKLDADGKITDEPVELLAADAREQGDGKNLALAKVVAGLLGVSSDDVFRRAERERRRRGRIMGGIVATFLALVAIAGSFAYFDHQKRQTLADIEALVAKYAVTKGAKAVPGAKQSLTKAITSIAQGAARDPRYAEALELLKAGNIEEAEPLLAAVAEDRKRLVTKQSEDAAEAFRTHGSVLVSQNKIAEALEAYQEGLALAERLAKDDPSNAGWQRDLSVSYEKVGNVLIAQGKLAEALASSQDSLAIRERLAKADPGNAGWQRDLSVSYNQVGDVLIAQGKLAEALASYQESLAIRERLAKADPGNAGWQRDLSISHERVGIVQKAQGKLAEALASYQESLAIAERLAKADPGNAGWQRDLSVSYNQVGDVLIAQGKLAEALKAYRGSSTISKALLTKDGSNTLWLSDLDHSIAAIGGLGYRFVLAHEFKGSLEASDEAIGLASDQIWLHTNRAHALMFLGRTEEARALYLKYRGTENVQEVKSWENVILDDFAALREAKLTHPLMDEIAELFAADVTELDPEQPAQAAR